jgi:phenol 2-monooxygenase
MLESAASPVTLTPATADLDEWFDVKVIFQQDHTQVDIGAVPRVFRPRVGEFQLVDLEKIYAADPQNDIFDARGIDRDGVVVVVRPDQYVAAVLPLSATDDLGNFFAPLSTALAVR